MRKQLLQFSRSYRPHIGPTISLSIPVIIGQLGHVLMGVIDSIMIGDLGPEYLSAASLTNSIFFMTLVVGIGVAVVISPLTAEASSSGNKQGTADYLQQGLVVGLGLSVVMFLINTKSVDLMYVLDQPPRDVELAHSYMLILNWSILPMMLFMMGKHFTDGLSHTRPAMYITLAGLAINVGLNYLLIYGKAGLPRLELDGAGYGTLIARIVMMALMIGYIWFRKDYKAYWQGWEGVKPKVVEKILRLGLPSGLQYLFEMGAFSAGALMIGWIGSEARAAHQMVISLASVTFMVVTGISAGASIRVGNYLGKQDYDGLQRAGFTGILLGTAFMSCSAVVFVLCRNVVPFIFQINDPEVVQYAAVLMILAAWFQVFDGIQAVGAGVLRGIQDVNVPTLITFVAYWLVLLPVGYLLAFPLEMGVVGIWWGYVIGLVVSSFLLTYRFWRKTQRLRGSSVESDLPPIPQPSPASVGE
ncbi:MAG: MATE family efflux transporter [Bacteroidota bacterium]